MTGSRNPARTGFFSALWLGALIGFRCVAATPYQPDRGDPLLESWRWRAFTDMNGLDAQCVAQGKEGTIWFGTMDGLSSYDGFEWRRHFATNGGVVAGWVSSIAFESDGALDGAGWWGISQFRNGTWTRLVPSVGVRFADVRRLAIGPVDSLWAATSWGALQREGQRWILHTDTATAARLEKDPNYSFLKIVLLPDSVLGRPRAASPSANRSDLYDVSIDARGRVWFGTKAGEILCHTPPAANAADAPTTSGQAWTLYNEDDGLAPGRSTCILPLKDGSILAAVAPADKLCIFDGTAWRSIALPAPGLAPDGAKLLQTRDGVIWVSARYVLFAQRDGQWHTYQKPHVPVPTALNLLLQSVDGALWLVGPNTDVQRVDYETSRWVMLHDLNFQWESPAGAEWFLHRDGRVVVHDGSTWTSYGVEDGLIDSPVALLGARDGAVWVAGNHEHTAATAVFDGRTWTRHIHAEFSWGIDSRAMAESSDGSLWFGAAVDSAGPKQHRDGILQYRAGTWIHHHQPGRAPSSEKTETAATLLPAGHRPEPIEKYSSIGESPDGKIWAGRNVLAVFDGARWEELFESADFRIGIIESMHTTRERDLWVGTRQYGALRYDGRTWQQHQGNDSLAANSVRSFAQTTDGSLWAATDRGISRFDGQAWTNNVLPEALSVPHDRGNLKAAASGRLWLNRFTIDWTRRGWTRVPPPPPDAEFWTVCHQSKGPAPETVITTKTERISQPGNISVLWNGTAPWRGTSDPRLQFSYRLDGGVWSRYTNETGHAFFTLPKGAHHLEVRARDYDFNEDPTPATLAFAVLPPVWEQGWFLVLIVVSAGLIVTQSVRVFLERGRLRRTNRALAAEMKERQSAEVALHENAERLRLAVQGSNVGLWDWDLRTNRVLFSREWKSQLGYAEHEIADDYREWERLLHPDDRAPTMAALREYLDGKRTDYVVEFRLLHKDGGYRWIYARGEVHRDASGKPVRMLGCHVDTTERKLAEEEIRLLNAELEQRVVERTRQLQAANHELGSFSYSVSHDLRAPLRSIDGFSRILLEDYASKLDEEGQDHLQRVRRASQRMGRLIDDMLRLSRTHRAEIRRVDLDLSALVHEIAGELRVAEPARTVAWEIAPALTAHADRVLIRAALENLLGNAWKFTGRKPSARIAFGAALTAHGRAFFVRDNGAGFDMAYASQLFEPFKRLHTGDEFPGSGIGLATVHRIIVRHGGRIWAEAAPDAGATFFFTLPDGVGPP